MSCFPSVSHFGSHIMTVTRCGPLLAFWGVGGRTDNLLVGLDIFGGCTGTLMPAFGAFFTWL
ncbi:hypothetical protein B0T11DRAFT_275720 [Plectosphaerella cucumerina]|uniref:Uncharacterized protein n=1 Tax=Plectosphaerella cucumerina TaxID=40658 RepID=A0A8K0TJ12_9PEZI|nr:hypothetical protein B0T11DRAFT_275720 [Plectosphaerella cucumerina]